MGAKFRLVTEHLYWWPVVVKMPHPEKSGKWQELSFEARFAMVGEDQAREEAEAIAALETEAERLAARHDTLIGATRDWRGVVDGAGAEIPFSAELLRQAMGQVWFREGLYRAYNNSLFPEEARRGN